MSPSINDCKDAVACPKCHAHKTEPCWDTRTTTVRRPLTKVHEERWEAYFRRGAR